MLHHYLEGDARLEGSLQPLWGLTKLRRLSIGDTGLQGVEEFQAQRPECKMGRLTDEASPLWNAAYYGQARTDRVLLEARCDVNSQDATGSTPLLIAAVTQGFVDVVLVLLEFRADVEQAKKNGVTPLLSAAQKGRTATAELLIQSGADLNQPQHNGHRPLTVSAKTCYPAMVQLLLSSRANVNALGFNERTALDSALIELQRARFEPTLQARAQETVDALKAAGAVKAAELLGIHFSTPSI